MEKNIWRMVDICKVLKTVDFGEPVTKQKAIEMWLNEEYLDVVDQEELEILDFVEAR